jgi:Zn/Cd-binding protein ZinT
LRERRNGLQCQNQACDQQLSDWRGSMQSHHPIEYKRVTQIEALLEVSGECRWGLIGY